MLRSDHAAELAELVKAAIECAPEARQNFLNANCPPELRAEVESLLGHQQAVDGFMDTPAFHVAAESLSHQGAFAVGKVIGNYEIVSLIGKGGMGEVYLAQDCRLNRRVALKLVRRGMDTDETARRFDHEQRLLAGLNHPNIAQLYGADVAPDGIPFFAMEYIDGTRIDDHCRQGRLPLEQRLGLFLKVCAAVHYAHQHLVVHRDIKPSNILVTSDGEPKLLDFGIGKMLDAVTNTAVEQTITFQSLMTPEHASPEHIRGGAITTASDIYSLGVLLYELLTGSKPYTIETRTPVEIARIIAEQKPAPPSSVSSDPHLLRGDLDNVVLMAMRKEPQRRYSSVAQFAADIRRHLDGLPVIARRDTFGYRSSKFVRRHRVGVAAAALVIATLIAGIITTVWEARVARDERDRARAQERKTGRINQFLQTMLSFSNQSMTSVSPVSQTKNVTVNEMLDHIAPRVENELADEPDVRAQVLRTIGTAYASQGQYEQAEKNLRAALDAQIRLYGEQNVETAATMSELGVLCFREFKFEEANRLLEKAVSYYRSLRGTPQYRPINLALALEYLGDVKAALSEGKISIALMREAVEISSNAHLEGSERAVLALNKGDLGAALIWFGQTDEGERFLREAIEQFHEVSNQKPWELGAFLTMLGVAALNKNNLDEAQKNLAEGEQIYRQSLGDRTGYLCFNLERTAAVLLKKNELPAAEGKAREALAVARVLPGSKKLESAQPLLTLGDILSKQGKSNEAESCYRESLALYEQEPGKNRASIVSSKIRLSQVLLTQHRVADAIQIATEAAEEARQNLGPDNVVTKATAENLAAIQRAGGE